MKIKNGILLSSSPSLLLTFIPSIQLFITGWLATKVWKVIKIKKGKSDFSGPNATWRGSKKVPAEPVFLTSMEESCSKFYNNTSEHKLNTFLHLKVTVCIWDLSIFPWKALLESSLHLNRKYWSSPLLSDPTTPRDSIPSLYSAKPITLEAHPEEQEATNLEGNHWLNVRNYGPTIAVGNQAQKKGHQQVLWLF